MYYKFHNNTNHDYFLFAGHQDVDDPNTPTTKNKSFFGSIEKPSSKDIYLKVFE